MLLTLGTGIGGGIVVDGQLVRGARGAAGELGHMVVDVDGPPCPGNCPNRGCLEVLVSGTALGRAARGAPPRSCRTARFGRALARRARDHRRCSSTELAHDGDPAARDVVAAVGEHLGVGLGNVVNILNPEVVVVGGGVDRGGRAAARARAREVVAERALAPSRDQVRIVPTRFGDASRGCSARRCWPLEARAATAR